MTLHYTILFLAALLGGAMNSVAGGGSFFSFPALLFAGIDPKIANATNAVALWPGSAASVGAYRRELHTQRDAARMLSGVSLIGGLLGALLLLATPSAVFQVLLPHLMLAATLLFAFSPRINKLVRRSHEHRDGHRDGHPASPTDSRRRSIVLQGLIAIYGGFFGGGIGILMLAALSLMGLEDIHEMNALKTLLATLINGIAVVAFAAARVVAWPEAIVMAVGAIVGGYSGAALARQVRPQLVRSFVMVVGFVLSGYLFIH